VFSTFMVTFREGIESFLIVAITLAYLRKTHRPALGTAVFWGTGVAVVASFIAMLFLRKAGNQPFWEASLSLIAAVMVFSLTLYMFKNAKRIRGDIAERIETAALKAGAAAWLGVFLFVLLMIVREGMETALLLTSLGFQTAVRNMLIGGLTGVAGAAGIAWAWARYGSRIPIGRFLQVTAVFLLVFVVQLLVYSFHEFTEAGVIPGIDNAYWHAISEPYGPDGRYGTLLSCGMVILPSAWLLWGWIKDRGERRSMADRNDATGRHSKAFSS
jgi:high-affinity iron transporter